MSHVRPVQTVADQIATRLRAELHAGRFKPGEPLREEQVAERFGVSRHPVRKVFQQLALEGLLLARRNCGVTVASPPNAAVCELLMPMRVQIETYALRTCFDRLTRPVLQEWREALLPLRLACEAGDNAALFERDMDFHRSLLLRAGLDDLLPIWTLIINKTTSFYEHDLLSKEMLPAVHEVHTALLDVFAQGDVDAAAAALSDHILNGEFNKRVHRRWRAEQRRQKTRDRQD
ncbi:MAG: GntR family transcriptional regulator [Gemmataceae bacterium]